MENMEFTNGLNFGFLHGVVDSIAFTICDGSYQDKVYDFDTNHLFWQPLRDGLQEIVNQAEAIKLNGPEAIVKLKSASENLQAVHKGFFGAFIFHKDQQSKSLTAMTNEVKPRIEKYYTQFFNRCNAIRNVAGTLKGFKDNELIDLVNVAIAYGTFYEKSFFKFPIASNANEPSKEEKWPAVTDNQKKFQYPNEVSNGKKNHRLNALIHAFMDQVKETPPPRGYDRQYIIRTFGEARYKAYTQVWNDLTDDPKELRSVLSALKNNYPFASKTIASVEKRLRDLN